LPGKHHVQNEEIVREARRLVEGLFSISRTVNEVPFLAKAIAERHSEGVLVLDEQDAVRQPRT